MTPPRGCSRVGQASSTRTLPQHVFLYTQPCISPYLAGWLCVCVHACLPLSPQCPWVCHLAHCRRQTTPTPHSTTAANRTYIEVCVTHHTRHHAGQQQQQLFESSMFAPPRGQSEPVEQRESGTPRARSLEDCTQGAQLCNPIAKPQTLQHTQP